MRCKDTIFRQKEQIKRWQTLRLDLIKRTEGSGSKGQAEQGIILLPFRFHAPP
jgi:hypothetical protein